MVGLPASLRDSIVRGDFEDVPPEFRDLVRRYLKWLQKEAGRSGSGD